MPNPNGTSPFHCVWEWRFPDNRRFIGWGVGFSPWLSFTPLSGSEIEAWLREGQPVLDWSLIPSVPLTHSTAVGVCQLARKLRRDQGLTLVRHRAYGPFCRPRPITVGGITFPSETAASRALGISRRQVANLAGRPRP